MLKIYVNDDEVSFGRHSYIVISEDNLRNGCCIKHLYNKLGYFHKWNKSFFRPLNKGEVIDFNVDGNKYLKFFDNKLFSYRESNNIKGVLTSPLFSKQCVIDLKKGTIEPTQIDKYLESIKKPTIKLVNSKTENKFDIYSLSSSYRKVERYYKRLDKRLDHEWREDLIISIPSDDPLSIRGCRINNRNIIGYHNNWDSSVFTKISDRVSFPIDPSYMELRGSNLLIEGVTGDCVIDLKKGTINEIELGFYKSQNPLIIKLKNKAC